MSDKSGRTRVLDIGKTIPDFVYFVLKCGKIELERRKMCQTMENVKRCKNAQFQIMPSVKNAEN